jgi:ABC-type transport system substrate-binding protein/serine/threonine protein kinase
MVAARLGQQFGNYQLVNLLGQGGYAEVYLGQHVRLDLQAAIKVLHTHLTGSEAEHFQQEAQTIAKLTYPSIIRVFDFDVQDGTPFLVMDYAQGGSLRQRYPKGSLVPLPQIISCVKQMAAALQYAHDKKFIHRDVKPENMLIGQHQEVLLSDFGIATIAHSTSSLNVGAEGASGTLAYMAPEQIEGHPRAASDQYALGVVVYEWLCGERPFEGSVSELIAQQLSMPPSSMRERVPTIPSEIDQVVLRALAKDPKERYTSVADFSTALEQASQRVLSSTAKHSDEQPAFGQVDAIGYETVLVEPVRIKTQTGSALSADLPVGAFEPTVYPEASTPHDLATSQSGTGSETPQSGQVLAPTAAVVSPPLEPIISVQRGARRLQRTTTLLIILAVLVVAGGVLGSVSLLTHFGVIGARSATTTVSPVKGGTWTDDVSQDPNSFIPNHGYDGSAWLAVQALYLPLFYGDAQGGIHAGAASEIPTIRNGGISADSKTWTFHLRPHLVWSDGQPYDARDVEYTWRIWLNPKFGAFIPLDTTLISGADVSADNLSITFHLTRAYVPFLSYWVDGTFAPLPAHRFSRVTPDLFAKSPDNLNPQVVSGPFMMGESVPGDHYTLVRNPRYYRASEGLPYLDKVIFRIVPLDGVLKDLQAGAIDSSAYLYGQKFEQYLRLPNYSFSSSPTFANFEALYFNFHNQILASHLEVRQAIAMAIDHPALIAAAPAGLDTLLCIDHGSAIHPGYDPSAYCPVFDPAAANKLLDDNGWVKGPDGLRSKGGQRLEFKYSTAVTYPAPGRLDGEVIVQHDLQAIGIKLDIQNYDNVTFFAHLLPEGKASPPSGAAAGRYDIAEFSNSFGYDPDDSFLLSCDQTPPNGNWDFYCNHALDALYRQEQTTADLGARQQIFFQIHEIYLTDFPFIVLYGSQSFGSVGLARKGTHNYQPSPIEGETINIWEWWCDNGKC